MTLVLSPSAATFLARADLFAILHEVPGEPLLPERVHDALVAAAPEAPGAVAVERAAEADAFRVVPVADADRYDSLRANDRLGDADAAALALADLVGGVVVADEPYLDSLAAAETIPTTTLPSVLLSAVTGGYPTARTLDAYDDLAETGWRGRGDLYADFIHSLDRRASNTEL